MQQGSITVRRGVADSPKTLSQGDAIPDGSWVEVPEGADITVRTTSHREITMAGPASGSVCPGGEDEIILAHGRVSSFPGTGVRPGVEVWVSTPLGVIRYSDAKIDVEVTAQGDRLIATAALARADFAPAPGVRIERGAPGDAAAPRPLVDMAIPAGVSLVSVRPPTPVRPLVADLVAGCARESASAEQALRALASPNPADGGDLGGRAAAHVSARRRARAACGIARAAAWLAPAGLDAGLLAELEAADEKRNQLTPLPARR